MLGAPHGSSRTEGACEGSLTGQARVLQEGGLPKGKAPLMCVRVHAHRRLRPRVLLISERTQNGESELPALHRTRTGLATGHETTPTHESRRHSHTRPRHTAGGGSHLGNSVHRTPRGRHRDRGLSTHLILVLSLNEDGGHALGVAPHTTGSAPATPELTGQFTGVAQGRHVDTAAGPDQPQESVQHMDKVLHDSAPLQRCPGPGRASVAGPPSFMKSLLYRHPYLPVTCW